VPRQTAIVYLSQLVVYLRTGRGVWVKKSVVSTDCLLLFVISSWNGGPNVGARAMVTMPSSRGLKGVSQLRSPTVSS